MRLGLSLRARGHRVTLAAPDLFADHVHAAGLDFAPIVFGAEEQAVLDHPHLWDPRRGFEVVWRATRPGMAQVPALLAGLRPDVAVAHPLALPEADLGRAARPAMRIAAAYLAPSNLLTVHDPLMMGPYPVPRWTPFALRRWLWDRAFAGMVDPVVLPGLNADRAAHGLPPAQGFAGYLYAVADLSVGLFPAWFGPVQPDWPRPLTLGDFPLYDPAPDAAPAPELRRFLDAGAPPVVFTPGTGNRQTRRYFAAALDALANLGLRGIFLTLHRDQVPSTLPASVLWQEFVPLRALLPHARAVVHHGGIGTLAEALRAGVPQLVAPLAHDQFDNAARIRALGAGRVLHAARIGPSSLTRALRGLLDDPRVRPRCDELAARLRTGGPAWETMVDALEA
jgi:rhamnosyltransferase subunit B